MRLVIRILLGFVGFLAVDAFAQGPPPPPPTCEEKLDMARFQKGDITKAWGEVTQEAASLSAQLRAMTKERDDLKAAAAQAAAAKPAPTPEEKK